MELINYSSNQKKAIEHGAGPLMVLAGPGSGKTFVITHRIKYLIKGSGINPAHILVVTFSRAAAKEMRDRFEKLYGKSYVTFGTFHSVFFSILKTAYGFSAEQIASDELRYTLIKELIKKNEIVNEDINTLSGNLLNEIALIKQDNINIKNYYSNSIASDTFKKLYRDYEAELESRNKLDFEDMLLLTYELLSERKDILKAVQERYQYILVDEFQDINFLQYNIIKLMAGKEQNITVVGDDDQSIYRFRGARPEIMLGFERDFRNVSKVFLDINFRSTTQIVDASTKLISFNSKRFPKTFKANNGSGAPVSVIEFKNPFAEVNTIVKDVKEYIKSGQDINNIAVLYRTNLSPRLLIERMMKNNIPFTIRDSIPNLFEHWVAKDIISYIKLATDMGNKNDLLRISNKPNRYISRDSLVSSKANIETLFDYYDDKSYMIKRIIELREHLRTIKNLKPATALRYIRNVVGYDEYIEEYCDMNGVESDECYTVLGDLENSASEFNTFNDWFVHMEDYKEELIEARKKSNEEDTGVRLMTFHSSKGLEFDIVYIIDVNEGSVPYKKAKGADEIEEERRMFYVAMTRARHKLFICYCKENFGKSIGKSDFIVELSSKANP
ncbi:ATP-dependent helicase [Lachnoanaerobaculum gingivalis]|uniref:ATP-dependent helicase n=1 Tax=Lachnoanaerobaculum gingivalis TaxID=2490855 RepID=UPI0024A6E961|nr:ATP-dependent helicase [Lachnoanaerobaculum gingivalis]WHE88548.1 ATP-dependent helicase [Lachnoanaerobaculum gingivalis]